MEAGRQRENPQISISEQLEAVLAQLSPDQLRYVIERQHHPSAKDAAEAIGLEADTVYRWPDYVKEAVRLMAHDGVVAALHIRRRNLAKAMQVKAEGLESDDERVKQKTATEIIEWELGTAAQTVDVTSGGKPLVIGIGGLDPDEDI